MRKITITELYTRYVNAKNPVEKEGFGTLYRMAGGKKNIPEYSINMMCYISGLDRLRRADMKYTEMQKKDREKTKLREVQIEFYLPRFKSILEYMGYVYGMGIEEEKDDVAYRYNFTLDSSSVVYGVLRLDTPDFYAELYSTLKRIKIEFDIITGKFENKINNSELNQLERDLLLLLQGVNRSLGTGLPDNK